MTDGGNYGTLSSRAKAQPNPTQPNPNEPINQWLRSEAAQAAQAQADENVRRPGPEGWHWLRSEPPRQLLLPRRLRPWHPHAPKRRRYHKPENNPHPHLPL